MIRTIRQLKKEMGARMRSEEIKRDEEGRVIVEMTVLNDDDFLSDYSFGRNPVISSGVSEFIDHSVMAFAPGEALRLNVYSDCIDGEEEKIYRGALKKYYEARYAKNVLERRRNLVIAGVMALIGICFLIATMLFSHRWGNPVLSEILDIFAWVFLWECADVLFLQRSVLSIECKRYLRLMDAKVEFFPLNETSA